MTNAEVCNRENCAGSRKADPRRVGRPDARVLFGSGRSGTADRVVQSYVTEDKLYGLYVAPGEERVREHARRGGFPADSISEVHAVIGPVKG